MSTDTLEFPPIDEAAAQAASTALTEQQTGAVDLTKIDLQAVALAGFNGARAAIATAKATLTNVQHDLSTPTKLADAKSLRNRLIKVPLADARATSTALKSRLTKVSKAVGDELAAIEADFEAAEKLITPQIEAAQTKLDAEREAARLKEEARVQAHRDNLAKLVSPAERAAAPDMTAERIANGIAAVETIVIDRAAWEEFADRAEEQKAVTLERMRALHTKAVAAEAEALRLAEERAEAARVAEAQRIEAKRLADERAELQRQREEFEARRQREEARRIEAEASTRSETVQAIPAADVKSMAESLLSDEPAPYRASFEDAQSEIMGIQQQVFIATAGRLGVRVGGTIECIRETLAETEALTIGDHLHIFKGAAQKAKDEAVAQIRALLDKAEAANATAEAASVPAAAAEAPMLKLGELWTLLGLDDREDFLASLGFAATPAPKGTGKLYREADVPAIRRAIAKRMTEAA